MHIRAALVVLAFPSLVFAATRHVEIGGSDNGDCIDVPCRTVSHAIVRSSAGDVIEVAGGKFESGIEIDRPVVLRGKQASVDARGRANAEETILGGNMRIVADGVVLDGFTIKCESCVVAVTADRASGVAVRNTIFRGGIVQLEFFSHAGAESEVRNNDFIGTRTAMSDLGDARKTFAVLATSMGSASLSIDSNRFSNHWAAVQTSPGFDTVRIEGNTFAQHARALVLASNAQVHVNRFAENETDIFGLNEVNAPNNWFGCNEGPSRCASFRGLVNAAPWLVMTATASPSRIAPQRSSVIVVDLNHNSDGAFVPGFPDGTSIDFDANGGRIEPEHVATLAGIATTTFTTAGLGEARVTARLDDVETPVKITTAPPRRRAAND